MKNSYKLFSVFPMYLGVLFSSFILIPLFGNLFINAIISLFITLTLYKKFCVGFYFKTFVISWNVGFIAVLISFFQELINKSSFRNYQVYNINKCFIIVGFIIGTIFIFLMNFFVNFGNFMNRIKPWRKTLKVWQRILFSACFTLLNAPYLILVIRCEWLKGIGFNGFYNVY